MTIASGSSSAAETPPRVGLPRGREGDAVVDLVADQSHVACPAPFRERGQFGAIEHGARWVRRGGDDESREFAVSRHCRIEQCRRRLVPGVDTGRDLDHLDAERGQDVAVGRVARTRERDTIAGVERGEEHELERARRSRGDGNAPGVDLDPVPGAVVAGDGFAQRRGPERPRVPGRLERAGRGPRARLPGAQRHDIVAGEPAASDFVGDPHDVERGDARAAGRSHASTLPARVR